MRLHVEIIVQNRRMRYDFSVKRNITIICGNSATGKTTLVDMIYVLVTRESIPSLPYSVEEIYGIHNSGKYGTLRKTYNEFYPLYSADHYNTNKQEKCLIVEDSNAGYEFFEGICEQLGYRECISAKGKSNVFDMLIKHKDEEAVVIADGAAFGSEMEKIK